MFPVTLPCEIPRLKFQIWDQALVRPNDAIAESVINLKVLPALRLLLTLFTLMFLLLTLLTLFTLLSLTFF